jgi:hypothetical protein
MMTACSDPNLNKVAKGLVDIQQTVGTLQTTVIAANKENLLSTENTRTVLDLCEKINLAEKDAIAITRTVAKYDNPTRSQILAILQPIMKAVNNAIDVGIVPIKDQAVKDKVKTALVTIQSTLNIIQLVSASGG